MGGKDVGSYPGRWVIYQTPSSLTSTASPPRILAKACDIWLRFEFSTQTKRSLTCAR
jgi:hypothetical protein